MPSLMPTVQFQDRGEAVFRPELRQNKEIDRLASRQP